MLWWVYGFLDSNFCGGEVNYCGEFKFFCGFLDLDCGCGSVGSWWWGLLWWLGCGFCKVEFNQPYCWLYSMPNLLGI